MDGGVGCHEAVRQGGEMENLEETDQPGVWLEKEAEISRSNELFLSLQSSLSSWTGARDYH